MKGKKHGLLWTVPIALVGLVFLAMTGSKIVANPNPENPDTWPQIPSDWDWHPATDNWISYHGATMDFYKFAEWETGLNEKQYEYLQYLADVAHGHAEPYVNGYEQRTMPSQFCAPYYPDWQSAWKAYHAQWLTAAEAAEVELTPVSTVADIDELAAIVSDEIAMKLGIEGAEPGSAYYKTHWYIFYRHCLATEGQVKKLASGWMWRLTS